MKVQTGKILIQDMGLKKGELFQIGKGPRAFVMRYAGMIRKNGEVYDRLVPVKK